jgi:RHS repeat-associated protein
LNRLTNETISALGSVGYGYDAVGNRTNRASGISSLASGSSSYTANDWLTSDQYDANGNTTNSASVAYRYDVLNRLVDYNHGAVTLDYNGDGQRVVKNVGGQVTYYVVDDRNPSGYAQVVEEITAYARTTNLTKVYAYGLDLISQQQPGVATNYYGHDGHGSVRYLTSTSGDITDTYTYDAYGNLIASIGSTANNYLYCGEQYDPQLKFYYNRARYLNPDTGRFWTTDTFAGSNEDPLSLHKYLYCQNDPVNGVDPSGKAVYFVERQFNSSLKYLWVDNIGHGYLLFTSTSDPGTDDPFESHQTIIDSFSYHPFRWNFDGSQAPSRVWENDTENDWNPGWHDALLVTTDATQQQALLKCVNNWITGGNSGYERGAPIEDHYTGYQGNTVGSLEHIRPPDDAVYYSTFGQNCVWWATVMLKQSNISVYPLVYQAIEEYNDGVSAATQVILGSRSCYKANRVTPMPKLFIPDIPMDDLYGSVL